MYLVCCLHHKARQQNDTGWWVYAAIVGCGCVAGEKFSFYSFIVMKIIGIAVNQYDDPGLNNISNCLNDLNEVISILSSRYVTSDIELLSKKEQTTFKFLYNKLRDELRNALKTESVLIIFAGHGEYDSELSTAYWLPSDAVHTDVSTWFDISTLLKFMKASNALHIALISDSCFAGGVFEASRGGGIKALEGKRSRLALTSGGLEKVSDGEKNGHSPFAKKLIQVLKDNAQRELSFSELAHNVLLQFEEMRQQTPAFGSLSNTGHEGGALIFRLNENSTEVTPYKEISLSLNLQLPIDIDYRCTIPLFLENSKFDSAFINAYVQHITFEAISKVRVFFTKDDTYLLELNKRIGFDLEIGYNISVLNDDYLSMIISVDNYFGGAHPSTNLYPLNFAFHPDLRLYFDDVVDYSEYGSFEYFLSIMVDRFADVKQKDILIPYLQYQNPQTLDFFFDDSIMTISFLNSMPRVVMALSMFDIPLTDLKLKI